MSQDFYPFVGDANEEGGMDAAVRHPARIAVYDDASAAPRVVLVEPKGVREYLEEITLQVSQLAQTQGGSIPFMVIREIVENFIHAYFLEPTISILDHGNTICFSDQGPGIQEKERALQYGTTSATEEMRLYIRGVGSGLPYVQQYLKDKGGYLEIDDNIAGGTVVTIALPREDAAQQQQPAQTMQPQTQPAQPAQPAQQWWPQQQGMQTQQPQQWWPQQSTPQQMQPQGGYPPQGMPWPQQTPYQQPMGYQQQAPQAQPLLSLTVRGRAIIDYLASHDSVGPSDLSRAYGESQPTWTRELQTLEEMGLVRKDGQKRRLTTMGRTLIPT